MKNLFLSLVVLLNWSSFASAMTCYGIQDTKGARGTLSSNGNDVNFSYVDKASIQRLCVIGFDSSYKPRTSDPQKDRYLIDRTLSKKCGAEVVWVSKSLNTSGKGFVDVEFPCGGGGGCAHGESGPIDSFICRN